MSQTPSCFHCGEPCPDGSPVTGDKPFCCAGCLTVHELLTESGLGHFYELASAPGVRNRVAGAREPWSYLDEPALQRQLLDFTDGRVSKVTLKVPQVHCVACVWLLENLFRLRPGIGPSQVNFPRREVAITFSPDQIRFSEVVALLASIGYEPVLTLGELEARPRDPTRRRRWLQVGIAGFAFGNIMLLSLPQYLGLDSFSGPLFRQVFGWLSLALALPVVIYSAADYWKSAARSLRQRTLTLDVPIAVGLVALYAQSAWEILSSRGEGYLDSLTGLVFFLLCGRVFQHVTQERLAFDRDYKSFFPLSVNRKTSPPAGEERVALSQLRIGDRVVIRHGELIPADAVLRQGPARIDYSFVTGEAEPVAKASGDYLYAGGRQIDGAIEVEIVKAVSQSYLTSLWAQETFQKDRDGGVQTLTDRFGRRFTLAVLLASLGTAAFWLASGDPGTAFRGFIAVLIVACPCALALAAPFTFGTAQRWLARRGVFLRNTLVLERLAHVDTVVFDKTGTLTTGGTDAVTFHRWDSEPSPASGIRDPASGLSEAEARWIAALARHSTHPHAIRLCEALAGSHPVSPTAASHEPSSCSGVSAERRHSVNDPLAALSRDAAAPGFMAPKHGSRVVEAFRETPGCGIEGRVEGHDILLGSRAWLEARGLPRDSTRPSPDTPAVGPGRSSSLGSAVWAAIDGQYLGEFTLDHALRPEVGGLIRRLGDPYHLALLSGDHAAERERFRALFPANAELLFDQGPLEKLAFVERLQRAGRSVMMVGDGLNDAGALRQSHVGVAVVEQAGAFSPASDVILEAGQLPRLAEVLALSRAAAGIVHTSFGLSATYNLVGVSIAATGHLSPLIAAILMPLSSFSVVSFACVATTWVARRTGLGRRTEDAVEGASGGLIPNLTLGSK
jgi:Cu+-exporting ATPase